MSGAIGEDRLTLSPVISAILRNSKKSATPDRELSGPISSSWSQKHLFSPSLAQYPAFFEVWSNKKLDSSRLRYYYDSNL